MANRRRALHLYEKKQPEISGFNDFRGTGQTRVHQWRKYLGYQVLSALDSHTALL